MQIIIRTPFFGHYIVCMGSHFENFSLDLYFTYIRNKCMYRQIQNTDNIVDMSTLNCKLKKNNIHD